MTRGSCVAHVTRAVTAVPGVDSVEVSLSANTADLRFAQRSRPPGCGGAGWVTLSTAR